MYLPTLGGILKLQQFFLEKKFELPIFQIDVKPIGDTNTSEKYPSLGCRFSGRTVSLREMIEEFGYMHQISNASLSNEDMSLALLFVDKKLICPGTKREGACVIFSGNNDRFENLANNFQEDIGRFGKANPSPCDKFKFRWYPRIYSKEVFLGIKL